MWLRKLTHVTVVYKPFSQFHWTSRSKFKYVRHEKARRTDNEVGVGGWSNTKIIETRHDHAT